MCLFNTLTRRKEEFVPREAGRVAMYVCGPTTYNYIHLGNARPLVFFDTVRRYFAYRNYAVTFVQNFTDVDDKIINRAREEGEDPRALADRYVNEYFHDVRELGVRPAALHPRVSGHIPEIIDLVSILMEKGKAYQVDGDVLFAVRSFAGYGKLSGRSVDDLLSGARVEIDPRKRDPLDFALWKAAKPGEPAWDSPWGKGRPGWHIECSAMSLKYLGESFDIHGGGSDLIFPHHENELAQSEAALERPFVRYWMHNGFITVNQEKMSKSLGNFFLVRDLLGRFSGEVIRFFLLSTHYRSPLDFDLDVMESCSRGLARLKNSIGLLYEALGDQVSGDGPASGDAGIELDSFRQAFETAMDDDFNTAAAVSVQFDLAHAVNASLHEHRGCRFSAGERAYLYRAGELFHTMNEVLGIFPVDDSGRIVVRQACADSDSEQLLSLLLDVREKARSRRDWATADQVRNGLKELGIILEDTPDGVRWKRQGQIERQ
ncbi:MAG TPA: cysteine--tRNA ligase [Spirochaetia bacterium]|nr:cysteine--tRNA ligase [Spirochaetia bacterium]